MTSLEAHAERLLGLHLTAQHSGMTQLKREARNVKSNVKQDRPAIAGRQGRVGSLMSN